MPCLKMYQLTSICVLFHLNTFYILNVCTKLKKSKFYVSLKCGLWFRSLKRRPRFCNLEFCVEIWPQYKKHHNTSFSSSWNSDYCTPYWSTVQDFADSISILSVCVLDVYLTLIQPLSNSLWLTGILHSMRCVSANPSVCLKVWKPCLWRPPATLMMARHYLLQWVVSKDSASAVWCLKGHFVGAKSRPVGCRCDQSNQRFLCFRKKTAETNSERGKFFFFIKIYDLQLRPNICLMFLIQL